MRDLLFQRNLFHEDDQNHMEIANKYFNLYEVDPDSGIWQQYGTDFGAYRCSITTIKRLNRFERFTNAIEWAGKLRRDMISNDFYFQTIDYILDNWPIDPTGYSRLEGNKDPDLKLFIRPVAGDKTFAGDVFDYEKLKREYAFLLHKNIDPFTVCMVSEAKPIKEEYRLIFMNYDYVSGSQYMLNGELCVKSEVPSEIINYGRSIQRSYYLPPWVVLDVGINQNGFPKVIELNQIETSSFYGADLDKIYKTWADLTEK